MLRVSAQRQMDRAHFHGHFPLHFSLSVFPSFSLHPPHVLLNPAPEGDGRYPGPYRSGWLRTVRRRGQSQGSNFALCHPFFVGCISLWVCPAGTGKPAQTERVPRVQLFGEPGINSEAGSPEGMAEKRHRIVACSLPPMSYIRFPGLTHCYAQVRPKLRQPFA
jgi:hypothetical protein